VESAASRSEENGKERRENCMVKKLSEGSEENGLEERKGEGRQRFLHSCSRVLLYGRPTESFIA
jgi:hypothetical protein